MKKQPSALAILILATISTLMLLSVTPVRSETPPNAPPGVPPDVAPKPGPLDGKSFSGDLIKTGEKTGDPETLTFAEGKFRTKTGDAHGFDEVPYHVMKVGETMTFRADAVSQRDGKMSWNGRIQGDHLEANLIWTGTDEKRETYTIKAKQDPGR